MGIFRAASPDSPAAAECDAFLSRNVNEVLRRDAIGGAALGFISSALLAVLLLTGSARDLWMPVIEARACGAGSLGIRAPTRRNLLCEPLGEVK